MPRCGVYGLHSCTPARGCCFGPTAEPLFLITECCKRDRPVRVWGLGQAGEMVTVRFHGQSVTAETDTIGNWEAWLKPEPAGGPYTLSVSSNLSTTPVGAQKIFWSATCGWPRGSRTWSFPLAGFTGTIPAPLKDGEKEIAAADHPRIRLLLQKKATSTVPLTEASDGWMECTPDTARHFSAVAYLFGREISERERFRLG